jgi:hypothetical protein
MSLATYEEARPWAKAIKEELLEKRMPPWPAVRGFGEFRNAPPLTQRDVDAIVNWVEGGAPRGDPKHLPPGPLFPADWPLGPPDLVLTPDAAQEVGADADERRDIVLPTRLSSERWMSALDLRPGEPSVVHCASVRLEGPRPALLGTWVPGLGQAALPEGVARRIPAGARVRVRIHYRGSGQPAVDSSALGLYLSKARPARELRELSLAPARALSSPRATATSDQPLRASIRLPSAAEAVALVPRADPGLASVQATVYRPDGTSEVLVWTRGHRSDWQPTYFFKRPVSLPRLSRLEVIAHRVTPEAGAQTDGVTGGAEPPSRDDDPLLTLFYVNRELDRSDNLRTLTSPLRLPAGRGSIPTTARGR